VEETMYVEAKREELDGEVGGKDEADGELDGCGEGEDGLSDMTKRRVVTIARFDFNQRFQFSLFPFSFFPFSFLNLRCKGDPVQRN
jgi:hypothetical protein